MMTVQGEPGPQGARGSPGNEGAAGHAGLQGERGVQGPQVKNQYSCNYGDGCYNNRVLKESVAYKDIQEVL